MGLFDELAGGALKNLFSSGNAGQTGSGMNSLFNMAVGAATQNGMDNFVQKLTQNGLGNHVKSWIGTGKNKTLSSSKITKVFGPDIINEMVNRTGMKKALVTTSLASMLPEIINRLTPNGEVDEDEVKSQTKGFDFGDVTDVLGNFFR